MVAVGAVKLWPKVLASQEQRTPEGLYSSIKSQYLRK